ncbi:hypothetical protein [Celerinatantimonas diazotrophica]|uniref:hypothetical protein n=1 Tax=Celerinatantimonas diazotrophica TaxID=412034 RepID=UPI00104A5B91|nr:hypothetical protein [Celerinatantimonas diazotrophica]
MTTQSVPKAVQHTATSSSNPIQTLMISRDERYPLVVGSLIRFSPQMTQMITHHNTALKPHYQWLESQLHSLLNYRGFMVTPSSATLYFAAALYHPPLQKNTDSLARIYQANLQRPAGREDLSLLLRIYRRGAVDPLWQGAVDHYAILKSDGTLVVDLAKSRRILISLLKTIPMRSSAQ